MIRVILSIAILFCSTSFIQAQTACTRGVLQAAVDSYIAAQQSGDVSKMSFTPKAKFIENMKEITIDKGLWNTALPIAFHRSFLDTERCKTFTEAIITEGGHPYVLGTRLKVEDGKISEIDGLVTQKGDWLFNALDYLKYSKSEDWHVLTPAERIDRQALIDAGNQYLDMFTDKFVKAPWGIPCARLEGGAYTNPKNDPNATCKVGIPEGVLYIVNRSFVVDEEMGVVNIFCRFGSSSGMPDSHMFRLVNGKFRWVHTLSVANSPMPSPKPPAPKQAP